MKFIAVQTGFIGVVLIVLVVILVGIGALIGYGVINRNYIASQTANYLDVIDQTVGEQQDVSLNLQPLPPVSSAGGLPNVLFGPTTSPSPSPESLQARLFAKEAALLNVSPSPLAQSGVPPIPVSWKTYTLNDPGIGYTTVLSLPANFVYEENSGFFRIRKAVGVSGDMSNAEEWEVWLSFTRTNSGLFGENLYKGEPKRIWYENNILPIKNQTISQLEEYPVGNGSTYLKITVLNSNSEHQFETHYVYVENGLMHMINPLGFKAYESDAEIPKVIGKILYSMRTTKTK